LTIDTGQDSGNGNTYKRTEYVYSDGGSFKVCNKNMSTTKFFLYVILGQESRHKKEEKIKQSGEGNRTYVRIQRAKDTPR
jgi:hypothetical protein